MSLTIWTQCGGKSNFRELSLDAWRVVEAEHMVATRKLVDSDEEQALLEDLIERAKPPLQREPEFEGLHYLLATPFRYPPLRHGSRFGTRAERGIFYSSETQRAAFAEVAYYRLLFLSGTTADLVPMQLELSAFQVAVRTAAGIDLTRPPFADKEPILASPVSYTATQELGQEMRRDGVEAFRYVSARDRERGINVALFSPRAFAARRPRVPETWFCVIAPDEVEFSKKDFFERRVLHFPSSDFVVDGRLPAPAL